MKSNTESGVLLVTTAAFAFFLRFFAFGLFLCLLQRYTTKKAENLLS
jgi:hypothetical protein